MSDREVCKIKTTSETIRSMTDRIRVWPIRELIGILQIQEEKKINSNVVDNSSQSNSGHWGIEDAISLAKMKRERSQKIEKAPLKYKLRLAVREKEKHL